jgi:hypothetical protein
MGRVLFRLWALKESNVDDWENTDGIENKASNKPALLTVVSRLP